MRKEIGINIMFWKISTTVFKNQVRLPAVHNQPIIDRREEVRSAVVRSRDRLLPPDYLRVPRGFRAILPHPLLHVQIRHEQHAHAFNECRGAERPRKLRRHNWREMGPAAHEKLFGEQIWRGKDQRHVRENDQHCHRFVLGVVVF